MPAFWAGTAGALRVSGGVTFFYASWNPLFLPLLLLSISVNFVAGEAILTAHDKGRTKQARRWLLAGLLFNLGLLGIFKYSYFVISNFALFTDQSVAFEPMVLPLGISFITFQKIAYLVDCHRGLTRRYSFLDYLFFVSFFPQLIAGPIVHHRQLIGQVGRAIAQFREASQYWPVAAGLFSIGLAKKVCLADSLARYAGPAFAAAQAVPGRWCYRLARHAGLYLAAVFRFFRLFGYGYRAGASVRLLPAREFR